MTITPETMERLDNLLEKADIFLARLQAWDDHKTQVLLSLASELEAAAQVSESAHFPAHGKLLRGMAQRARAAGSKLELVK